MQVFCKGEPIQEVESIEEGKKFIKAYQRESIHYCESMLEETHALEKELTSLRPIRRRESFEEYNSFVKKNHKALFDRLEALGKAFFKEDYIDTYVYNSENYMYGWHLRRGDKVRADTLANLGLKITIQYALYDNFFEIK